MRFTRLLPSPAMIVALIALVVAAAGVTWAATSLPRNSVGGPQIRPNSVGSSDLRDRNVRHLDLAPNAVHGDNVGKNQIGGREILESNLGQVPSAVNAERLAGVPGSDFITADKVVPLTVKLSFGQSVEFVSNGSVGLEAHCRENVGASAQDELQVLAVTRQNAAFMFGDSQHLGPGLGSTHLQPNTAEGSRVIGGILHTTGGADKSAATAHPDGGFVASAAGEYIGLSDTTMYALGVAGADCLLVGSAFVFKP